MMEVEAANVSQFPLWPEFGLICEIGQKSLLLAVTYLQPIQLQSVLGSSEAAGVIQTNCTDIRRNCIAGPDPA